MWFAGCIAAMSSVTYPAISAFASSHASPDQQGTCRSTLLKTYVSIRLLAY